MTVQRAVHDPEVIAEWSRRVERSRRSAGWIVPLAALVLLATALAAIAFGKQPVDVYVGVGAAATIILLRLAFVRSAMGGDAKCPHCEKVVLRPFERATLIKAGVDYCPHCGYWLVDPHGGVPKS